jgi:transketolase
MRRRFSDAIAALAGDPTLAFLTGDLGFMALEPVRDALGTRFLNAGVAEQNMISVAAGLARTGLRPWAYSIAPFLYARPFEQVRNDVCLHHLPVRLVGNGGGYGYGVMGATHHALEDYGALLTLDAMTVLVPAFGADVAPAVTRAHSLPGPSYLRLGLAEEPAGSDIPAFAPWRRVVDGDGPVVLACGPIAGTLLAPLRDRPEAMRPRLWVVSELPFAALPPEFLDDLRDADRLVVVEEHVAHGGVGQAVALALAKVGATPSRVDHRHALGYPSGRYGSQKWHRAECGLDAPSLLALVDDQPNAVCTTDRGGAGMDARGPIPPPSDTGRDRQ